jgi:hypothetical protein
MSTQQPTQATGDKTRQALAELCSLQQQHPEKARLSLLKQVEIKYDLNPKECEFLDRNFQDTN